MVSPLLIDSVRFRNFKILKDATLPLRRITLIAGANGGGKSAALEGLHAAGHPGDYRWDRLRSAGARDGARVEVEVRWSGPRVRVAGRTWWTKEAPDGRGPVVAGLEGGFDPEASGRLAAPLRDVRCYRLDARAVAEGASPRPAATLGADGAGLAAVLERLRDAHPDRFEALTADLAGWFPEFDRVLLEGDDRGGRTFALRLRAGGHALPAGRLAQGTLLGLALLTLAHAPDLPPLVAIEEPDRSLHPRLLRGVRDALHRLGHPESCGEARGPVQVIATTHSPYMLDLFRDHPEEIVLARRSDLGVTFERLSDRPDLDEILEDANLGDVWYSGILGGVPDHR